jgi:hypothetical protein
MSTAGFEPPALKQLQTTQPPRSNKYNIFTRNLLIVIGFMCLFNGALSGFIYIKIKQYKISE